MSSQISLQDSIWAPKSSNHHEVSRSSRTITLQDSIWAPKNPNHHEVSRSSSNNHQMPSDPPSNDPEEAPKPSEPQEYQDCCPSTANTTSSALSEDVEPPSCSICLNPFRAEKPIGQLGCHYSHRFHADCIKEWFKSSPSSRTQCPICRKEITSACWGQCDLRTGNVKPDHIERSRYWYEIELPPDEPSEEEYYTRGYGDPDAVEYEIEDGEVVEILCPDSGARLVRRVQRWSEIWKKRSEYEAEAESESGYESDSESDCEFEDGANLLLPEMMADIDIAIIHCF